MDFDWLNKYYKLCATLKMSRYVIYVDENGNLRPISHLYTRKLFIINMRYYPNERQMDEINRECDEHELLEFFAIDNDFVNNLEKALIRHL